MLQNGGFKNSRSVKIPASQILSPNNEKPSQIRTKQPSNQIRPYRVKKKEGAPELILRFALLKYLTQSGAASV
jgi:hypothetical protein